MHMPAEPLLTSTAQTFGKRGPAHWDAAGAWQQLQKRRSTGSPGDEAALEGHRGQVLLQHAPQLQVPPAVHLVACGVDAQTFRVDLSLSPAAAHMQTSRNTARVQQGTACLPALTLVVPSTGPRHTGHQRSSRHGVVMHGNHPEQCQVAPLAPQPPPAQRALQGQGGT